MMDELQKKIAITFTEPLLLKEAVTHRSFINENPDWPTSHNERLEFLGDAVLELVTTRYLFDRYPDNDEGNLTSIRSALVNHRMLLRVAEKLGLEQYVHLSKGERGGNERARATAIANAVEALIGAIYLDRGYAVAKEFVEKFILTDLERVMKDSLYLDPKSILQEVIQKKKQLTPHYKVMEETGPDHQKEFIVAVFCGDEEMARGEGRSKQDAERVAAKQALETLKNNEEE